MWFLLLQISFLLLLAALCGAALTYWWLKGRYEDVTESYESLTATPASQVDLMARDELETKFAALSDKLERLENADLDPVHQRLNDLASQLPTLSTDVDPLLDEIRGIGSDVQRGQVDASSIDERLSAIEASFSQFAASDDQIELLGQRLTAFEGELNKTLAVVLKDIDEIGSDTPPPDQTEILSRLDALGGELKALAPVAPEFAKLNQRSTDFEQAFSQSLKAAIEQLDEKISALHNADLTPLNQQLEALEGRLSDETSVDLTPLNEALSGIAANVHNNSGNHDALSALSARLTDYEAALAAIKQSFGKIESDLYGLNERVDFAPILARINEVTETMSALRPELSGLSSLTALESNVAHLREMVFNLRERDLSTLNSAVRSMEARTDFVGVENRLTSIEYGLAATHHMLRSRFSQAPEMPATPRQDPFQSPSREMAFPTEPPPRPHAPLDPLDAVRKPGELGNLLVSADYGQADDLEKIRGVGPMLRQLLNDVGVFYYWQIAGWSEEDIADIDEKLPGYHGRITRDSWVEQAAEFARDPNSAKRPQPFGSAP